MQDGIKVLHASTYIMLVRYTPIIQLIFHNDDHHYITCRNVDN